MMNEIADMVFKNGENLSVNVILCFVALYALWRMHGFEKRHDVEFKQLRDEHREEREKTQAHTNAALDKIALEISAANKERAEIKELVKSMMAMNANTERTLHDLGMFVGAKCETKKPKGPRTNLTNWSDDDIN